MKQFNKETMNTQKQETLIYRVGDVVQTTESFGPNAAGSVGIVYETYPDDAPKVVPVVSVLLTNGHDIGCFSGTEQAESLVRLGQVELSYNYTSPSQLMTDYRNGLFRQALEQALALGELARSIEVTA